MDGPLPWGGQDADHPREREQEREPALRWGGVSVRKPYGSSGRRWSGPRGVCGEGSVSGSSQKPHACVRDRHSDRHTSGANAARRGRRGPRAGAEGEGSRVGVHMHLGRGSKPVPTSKTRRSTEGEGERRDVRSLGQNRGPGGCRVRAVRAPARHREGDWTGPRLRETPVLPQGPGQRLGVRGQDGDVPAPGDGPVLLPAASGPRRPGPSSPPMSWAELCSPSPCVDRGVLSENVPRWGRAWGYFRPVLSRACGHACAWF